MKAQWTMTVFHRWIATLTFPFAAGCVAPLGPLGEVAPDEDAGIFSDGDTRAPETVLTDSAPPLDAPSLDSTPKDVVIPDTFTDLDAGADTAPRDTLPPDALAPGILRCDAGPGGTACDLRSTGNMCCLLAEGRRCVGPDEPVPGDFCPAPAWCDDGADCRRVDPTRSHCCVQINGAASCRSVCNAGETDAP